MDTVSLAQFGITNCVATLGTATNEQHLNHLFRHSAHIVFCFDGDKAGHQAAWRALKNSLPMMRDGRQLQFMFLPDGEDPDSYIRNNGVDSFLQLAQDATPFSKYFFGKLSENINLETIDARSVLANRAKPLLKEIPAGVFQQLMLQQLNSITGYKSKSSSTLSHSALSQQKAQLKAQQKTQQKAQKKHSFQMSPVRYAIRMLLEYPALGLEVDTNDILKIDLAGMSLLCELIKTVQQSPDISCGSLLERWRESDNGKHLNKLAGIALEIPQDGIEKEFEDTINHLQKTGVDQQIQTLLDKSQREPLSADEAKQLAALYQSK